MEIRPKLRGFGLDVRIFKGKSKRAYLVFRTGGGAYHTFLEVEAKQAARDCGAAGGHTRQMWGKLWDRK